MECCVAAGLDERGLFSPVTLAATLLVGTQHHDFLEAQIAGQTRQPVTACFSFSNDLTRAELVSAVKRERKLKRG